MKKIDVCDVKNAVFSRPDDSNKGTLGSLLSICGSYGMAGAGIMAGKSALRCGLGLLKSAVPRSIYPIFAGNILESVFFSLSETNDGHISRDNTELLLEQAERSSAVLIGCGLGVCDDTREIVDSFIEKCTKPMVLDADALNCVAENPSVLKKATAPIIITPHPGEMGRLVNLTAKAVNASRAETALGFAHEYGVVTVLKGAGTVVASPSGEIKINPTGNSGMATGGSGDVLAGMVGSILAQGAEAFNSACAGVYLHGLAGDIARDKLGKISMLPTDTINCISLAYQKCGF